MSRTKDFFLPTSPEKSSNPLPRIIFEFQKYLTEGINTTEFSTQLIIPLSHAYAIPFINFQPQILKLQIIIPLIPHVRPDTYPPVTHQSIHLPDPLNKIIINYQRPSKLSYP